MKLISTFATGIVAATVLSAAPASAQTPFDPLFSVPAAAVGAATGIATGVAGTAAGVAGATVGAATGNYGYGYGYPNGGYANGYGYPNGYGYNYGYAPGYYGAGYAPGYGTPGYAYSDPAYQTGPTYGSNQVVTTDQPRARTGRSAYRKTRPVQQN